MKQLMIILALAGSLGVQAQKKGVRLYAFRQEVSKGISNATIDEKGETRPVKTSPVASSMIYIEFPKGTAISISELWINGKKYNFDTTTVQSPVVLNTGINMPGQQDRILIPQTSNALIRIMPKEPLDITDKNTRNLAKHNEVVVYFKRKGRECRKTVDRMQEVEKMVMQ